MSNVAMQEIDELFSAVLELAVSPVVLELVEEAKQPIELRAIALSSGQKIEKSMRLETDKCEAGVAARGEVRMLLKSPGYPCSFEVEAIFEGLSPGTGFSGFSMRGRAKLEDGKPFVKLTAHSNRYNVWEWSRGFRVV